MVFDIKSLNDVKSFFDKYDYFILETRINILKKIYLSPSVIFGIIKNFHSGNIFTVYLLSLLEIIKPKVVITKIDNSFKFSELARICEKKYTLWQYRQPQDMTTFTTIIFIFKKLVNENHNKKIYLPHFFCFGDYEIKKFKELKLNIKNFYPVGDLQFSCFLEHIKKQILKTRKDICFITDYISNVYNHAYQSYNRETFKKLNDEKNQVNINMKEGIIRLTKYVIRFCKANNKTLSIPLKRDPILNPKLSFDEKKFFKKNFSKEDYDFLQKNFVEKDRKNYSSLFSLLESKVAVGFTSTLLRNKISIGGKALSCNLTKDEKYSFPLDGICKLDNCSYEEFEQRLLEILQISDDEFNNQLNDKKDFLMRFDIDSPASLLISKKLSQFGILKK